MGIWQDLIDQSAFTGAYESVKRYVRKLRGVQSLEPRAVIVTAPGEEGQVDYGDGPMVRDPVSGKYRRVRLFVMTLGNSRKSVRLLSFHSSSQILAYVFGRTRLRTRMVDGRGRKTKEFRQWHHQQWPVLIRDHHPGYITWEQYERNQQTIEANAYMRSGSYRSTILMEVLGLHKMKNFAKLAPSALALILGVAFASESSKCISNDVSIKMTHATAHDLPTKLSYLVPHACIITNVGINNIDRLYLLWSYQNTTVLDPRTSQPLDYTVSSSIEMSLKNNPLRLSESRIVTPSDLVNKLLWSGSADLDKVSIQELGGRTPKILAAAEVKAPFLEVSTSPIMRASPPFTDTCPQNFWKGNTCAVLLSYLCTPSTCISDYNGPSGAISIYNTGNFNLYPDQGVSTWQFTASDYYSCACAPCTWSLNSDATTHGGSTSDPGYVKVHTWESGSLYNNGCRSGNDTSGFDKWDGLGYESGLMHGNVMC
jgi:hypothetical protein